MSENILFNHLFNGEVDSCNNYLDEALQGGNNLVNFLSEMLYTAASIRGLKNEDSHPIIVMNCIKNIIGDNRESPSKILLSYCIEIFKDREIIDKAINAKKSGKYGNMSLGQIAKLFGLGTAGLGFLIDKTSDQSDVGLPADTMPEGQVKQGIVNPLLKRAQGGVMDLQDGGESKGPGTGTSDSIPAMLSDGEFVMTAKAVRGAGGGDRREGARKMYEAMDRLEASA